MGTRNWNFGALDGVACGWPCSWSSGDGLRAAAVVASGVTDLSFDVLHL